MSGLALTVRCAACAHEFDTGIRMDARNFSRATFAANYHVCPACGQRGTYTKADYKAVAPRGAAARTKGGGSTRD